MKAKSLIKLALSIVMLLIVVRMAKLDVVLNTLSNIPPLYALLVIVGYSVGQVLSSFKWWLIARAADIHADYRTALRAFFIGMYVNCFGLGTVGGDVTRGLLLAQGEPRKAEALASVVADRLQGLAILACIGSLAALLLGRHNLEPYLMFTLIGIGAGIIVGWFVGPWFVLKVLPPHNRFRRKIEGILHVFPKDLPTLAKVSAISVIFHLNQIALHKVMALALGVDVSWSFLLVTIPFVNIVSTLPISWMGLGVRENAYVFFLVPAVLSADQAVAFGAMWLLAVTAASAIGGIVAVVTKENLLETQSEAAKLEDRELKEGGNAPLSGIPKP